MSGSTSDLFSPTKPKETASISVVPSTEPGLKPATKGTVYFNNPITLTTTQEVPDELPKDATAEQLISYIQREGARKGTILPTIEDLHPATNTSKITSITDPADKITVFNQATSLKKAA